MICIIAFLFSNWKKERFKASWSIPDKGIVFPNLNKNKMKSVSKIFVFGLLWFFKLNNLKREIKDFEPHVALNGGIDGLSEIRKIVKKSSELIKCRGKLILEIAHDQKNEVKKILKQNGFYINKIVKDLAKNDRCVVGTKI